MEDKQIKVVKNWLELISVRDIQIIIGFANFYCRFIKDFSNIAILLTSLLKKTRLSNLTLKAFRADNNEIVSNGSDRANETIVNLSKNSKFKKLTYIINIKAMEKPNFLTLDAKKAFNHLRLAFIEALILQHFDLESHIQIKTNALGYAIGGVLSLLNLDSNASSNNSNLNKSDFGQWYLVVYFSRKNIPIKT